MPNTLSQSLHKAQQYGLGEFFDIIAELSQLSVQKGTIDRKTKELITLGIALAKNCSRCIRIHSSDAKKMGANKKEITEVEKIALYMAASPDANDPLWKTWKKSWREYALIHSVLHPSHKELIALGIAIIKQHKKQIRLHARSALSFCLPAETIMEVVPITLLMDGAPAISQIATLLEALEDNNDTSKSSGNQ